MRVFFKIYTYPFWNAFFFLSPFCIILCSCDKGCAFRVRVGECGLMAVLLTSRRPWCLHLLVSGKNGLGRSGCSLLYAHNQHARNNRSTAGSIVSQAKQEIEPRCTLKLACCRRRLFPSERRGTAASRPKCCKTKEAFLIRMCPPLFYRAARQES